MRAYVHVQRWGVSGDGLDPLINRIAKNLLIDRHRRVAPYLVPLDSAEEVGDPALDPTEEVIRRQRSREVRSAVSELPDRHQTALMYSLGGMSPAEVGERLGIGRNAADALLHRARRSLRERLRHVGDGAFGVVLWFRIRAREAASRVGILPADAAGVTTVPATIAAAAALVAAINIVSPAGASPARAHLPGLRSAQVAAHIGTHPAAAASGSHEVTSGRSVSLPAGASLYRGNGHVGGHAAVPNPTDPDEKLLGVAPDLFHDDNDSSAVGSVFDSTCSGREQACHAVYQDPTDHGAGR